MSYTKNDLVNAENLIKIIKRGDFKLNGMEAIAFTEACRWFNRIVEDIQKQVAGPQMAVKPVKEPVSAPSKSKKSKK